MGLSAEEKKSEAGRKPNSVPSVAERWRPFL